MSNKRNKKEVSKAFKGKYPESKNDKAGSKAGLVEQLPNIFRYSNLETTILYIQGQPLR